MTVKIVYRHNVEDERAQQFNSSIGGPSVEENKIQGILFIIASAFIFVDNRNCKLKCKQIYD